MSIRDVSALNLSLEHRHAALESSIILHAGSKLIIEIGKRGMRGYYFTYEQYKEIKKIQQFNDLRNKIVQYGYPSVIDAKNCREIVDRLTIKINKKAKVWIEPISKKI